MNPPSQPFAGFTPARRPSKDYLELPVEGAHINEGYKTDENSRQASRSQRSSTSINHDDDFAFKPLPSSDTDFAFDRTTQGGGRHDPEASIGSLEHGFPSAIHTRRSYNNIGPDESPESPLRDPTNLSSREPSLPRKSRPTSLQNARRAHDKAEDGNNGRTVETSSHYVPPNSLPEAVPFISAPRGNTAANTEEEPVKLEAPAVPLVNTRFQTAIGEEDYTRRYPVDDRGEEMGLNARVWKTYIDETDIADKEYIGDNNATLDGILIFAAIFSAIVTTFVTQTYQSLLADPQDALESLLVELVAVQRVAANGSSVNDVPSSESTATPFTASASDMWINSLWFVSLVLSLLTAFLAVLAKQWLYQYTSVTSGLPQHRALVRHARNLGLQEWHVPMMIATLPIILHISLAMFFAGLVVLLHSMLRSVAYLATSLVGVVYLAYIFSNILPILYPRCPYRTGLTPKLYQLCRPLLTMQLRGTGEGKTHEEDSTSFPTNSGPSMRHRSWYTVLSDLRGRLLARLQWIISLRIVHIETDKLWRDAERTNALSTKDFLEAKAVSWLYTSSYNPTAQQVVLEALAGLQHSHYEHMDNWDHGLVASFTQELRRQCERLCDLGQNAVVDVGRQMELYLRATVQLWPFIASEKRWIKTHIPQDGLNEDQYVSKHSLLFADALSIGASFPNLAKLKDFFTHNSNSDAGFSRPRRFDVLLALLHAAQHDDAHRYNRKVLTTLKDTSFFLSADDGAAFLFDDSLTYIADPTHYRQAAVVVVRKMLESVAALPRDGKVGVLLRHLLSLVDWNEHHENSEHAVWAEINAVLDGISQCIVASANASFPHSMWQRVLRRREMGFGRAGKAVINVMGYFIRTKTFTLCVSMSASGQSPVQQKIVQTITTTLDNLLVFNRLIPLTPPTVTLAIYLILRGLWGVREPIDYSFFCGQIALSDTLSVSFAGAEKSHLYEVMLELDRISRLHKMWLELRIAAHNIAFLSCSAYSVSTIAVSYLGNVSMEDAKQMEYIHQPDNLYSLCHILLAATLLVTDPSEELSHSFLRLTGMDDDHVGWIQCYQRLSVEDWTEYRNGKWGLSKDWTDYDEMVVLHEEFPPFPPQFQNMMDLIRTNAERARPTEGSAQVPM